MRRSELVVGEAYAWGATYMSPRKAVILSTEPLERGSYGSRVPGVLARVTDNNGSEDEMVIAPRDVRHAWAVELADRAVQAERKMMADALNARADTAAVALGGHRGSAGHGAHVRLTIEAAEALVALLGTLRSGQ